MGDFVNKLVLTAVSVAAFAKQDRMKADSVYIAVIGGVLTYAAEFILLIFTVNLFLVYFLAAGVKKTKYTLTGALLASFTGIVASVFLVR